MNAIMRFYAAILAYLQSDTEEIGAVGKILELAKKASPSWEATEKSVKFLEQCCNSSSTVEDDDAWDRMVDDFTLAAFRDLSIQKNQAAMDLFIKVGKEVSPCFAHGDDILIWARSIKERPDGSAVIVLHVSDIKRFRKLMLEEPFITSSSDDHEASLEDGIIIGS